MKPRIIRKSLVAIVLVVTSIAFQTSMASGLRSRINTTQIAVGDPFSLTLTVDAAGSKGTPDLTPLQKDFQILGTSQQSQTNIINGQRTDSFSWVVSLTPIRKGTLTIPAIRAGSDVSEPLTIAAVDQGALPAHPTAAGNISIDISVDPGTYYVQQEIPVTVRIHDGVGIREAQLLEPKGGDFLLTRTGDDQVNTVTRNGRETQVIERHYLVKPQKSGIVTVPPLTLKATVANPSARPSTFSNMGIPDAMRKSLFGCSFFDSMFERAREITVQSKPLAFEVKPRPTGDGVWFLPAKQVELHAAWSEPKPEFRVGEGMTRTIQMFALGASKEQLPDIPIANTDGVRVYLERTNDKSVDTAEGTAAIREFVVSVVPTRPGDVLLPAVSVKWWDTTLGREQIATLPAQTISVAPGAAIAAQAPSADVVNQAVNAVTSPSSRPVSAPPAGVLDNPQSRYLWLLLLMFVAASAAALLIVRYYRARNGATGKAISNRYEAIASVKGKSAEVARAERALMQGCAAHDLAAAYSALTVWLRLVRPSLLSGSERSGVRSFELVSELAVMEQQLYAGAADASWDGKRLLKVFNTEKRAVAASASVNSTQLGLPALYPT